MNWVTIYIAGKAGFEKEVTEQLEKSPLRFMPGTLGEDRGVSLFWLPEEVSLRELKKAIGSKVVFKYRLKFSTNLEIIKSEQTEPERLSVREEAMIREMSDWEKSQRFLHSA